jgi:UDP-glucose 4-epimerase
MKVLVTGGSGFIGSHVVDKLRDRGVQVRVFDMVMPTFRQDIEYYHGSLLDLDALRMSLNGIAAIFHLGAVADVKDVYEEPHYAESINVRGTINVLEAARRVHVSRVIYGSTTWVYSDAAVEHVDEDTPLMAPSHLYTATKIASEYYCQAYSKLYGTEFTILRYGIPYGPRARDGAVIPIFVSKAMKGEPLTIAGDGSQFRKFIYVEDLAEGNALALKPIAKNRIYNLDGTEKVTIRQIAETVKKILGDVRIESVPPRPGDFGGKEVSSERARTELGWVPRTSFEDGMRRYIGWFKTREDTRKAESSALDPQLSATR